MTTKKKQYDDDDGRVILDMDIEGMQWHDKRVRQEKSTARKIGVGDQMTGSEARRYTWYAVLAGLLIVTVFSVTWVLFILFCTKVWFR
jgi:hypothetical protein